MIYGNADDIRRVLRDVAPRKIAVAYVGGDWEKYVEHSGLDEIIVSPTLGSNPRAIERLMDLLGASSVHFLDDLHSKIYLGSSRALVGSANLSRNGFSDSGNREVMVLVDEGNALDTLNCLYRDYKESAILSYPSEASKRRKIAELKQLSRLARMNQVAVDIMPSSATQLLDYKKGRDRVHVVWYQSKDVIFNESAVRGVLRSDSEAPLEGCFFDSMQFAREDDIQVGDWILCWICTQKGLANKSARWKWMYVDVVIENGFVDPQWPKLAGQLKKHDMCEEPFELNRLVENAMVEVLNSGRFSSLLATDEWSLQAADSEVGVFLDHVIAEVSTSCKD